MWARSCISQVFRVGQSGPRAPGGAGTTGRILCLWACMPFCWGRIHDFLHFPQIWHPKEVKNHCLTGNTGMLPSEFPLGLPQRHISRSPGGGCQEYSIFLENRFLKAPIPMSSTHFIGVFFCKTNWKLLIRPSRHDSTSVPIISVAV